MFKLHESLQALYDIHKSYADNVRQGPIYPTALPQRKWSDEKMWIDFLGHRIASPLGVPAGPLLTSDWTTLAAQLGFDVVTYKTIRSQAYAGHPLPNVIFVKEDKNSPGSVVEALQTPDIADLSITNSFGMPSMSPDFLLQDIGKARDALQKGQLLIVSVVGTPDFSPNLAEDFVRAASIAKDAGAQVIEANFSCPNVTTKEGCLYNDPENSYRIASTLVKAVHPLPVIIKVGKYSDSDLFAQVLRSLARAGVRCIAGVNSVSMRVTKDDGSPALAQDRPTSGICGDMIRETALQWIKDARSIIAHERLDLELAGCGGITEVQHFDEFLEAGAKVALTATGMMWNPYLASQWHDRGA